MALMHEGALNNRRILKPETVALMCENHICGHMVTVGVLRTNNPTITNDVDLFHGGTVGWGRGVMLTPEPGPDGRSAGSVNWGGIFNTYYWLDPVKRVAGVVMTQILPFADMPTLSVCGGVERGVYAAIGGG